MDNMEQDRERNQIDILQVALAGQDTPVYDGALDQAQYERFKAALPTWRDMLMAMMLRGTGLRVMELLRLERRHYEVEGPEYAVVVKRSKKRQQRVKAPAYERIYLPPQLGVEMRHYILGQHLAADNRVFQVGDRWLRRVFWKAGDKALGRPVHPHEMRHLFLQTLVSGGVPIEAAAKLMGHDDVRTTREWYYDLTRDQRRQIGERIPA